MARLTWNDLRQQPWTVTHSTGTNVTAGVPCRIMGMVTHANDSAATELTVYNNTAASGDSIMLGAPISETRALIFKYPGVRFGNGLSIASGAADGFSVFYVVEGSA